MIRLSKPEDRPFIANSWLRSFHSSNWSGLLPTDLYWTAYEPLIDSILDAANTKTLVYCNPEDENQIFAYAVYSADTLYWLYVKQAYRNKKDFQPNIAMQLLKHTMLPSTPLRYVFNTYVWSQYLRKHGIGGLWVPDVLKDLKTVAQLAGNQAQESPIHGQ